MFTGLIKEIGSIKSITPNAEGVFFEIECPHLISEINIDDSIAVNGTCLTAVEVSKQSFKAQAVHVTLEKTNLGKLKEASPVNLELAMRANDRLGGHFVQGHINAVEKVLNIENLGENYNFYFSLSPEINRYLINEGSITVNGVSLTIAEKEDTQFMVTIIPHTFQNTTFGSLKKNDTVNIEVDVLAKYVESFLKR